MGESFQHDVLPHAPALMACMGVRHLDAAKSLQALMSNNHRALVALSSRVTSKVLHLTSSYGQRTRWLNLLRTTITSGTAQTALDMLLENQSNLLDLDLFDTEGKALTTPQSLDSKRAKRRSDVHRRMRFRGQAHSRRLAMLCMREQLYEYESALAYHVASVDALADCAAGQDIQRQLAVQSLVPFERAIKEYVDCGYGCEMQDELAIARRSRASSEGMSPPNLEPIDEDELRLRHAPSVLTAKIAWLRLLTTVHLQTSGDDTPVHNGGEDVAAHAAPGLAMHQVRVRVRARRKAV